MRQEFLTPWTQMIIIVKKKKKKKKKESGIKTCKEPSKIKITMIKHLEINQISASSNP